VCFLHPIDALIILIFNGGYYINKITEIIPDDIPEWAQKSFDEGNFFRTAIEKVSELQEALEPFAQFACSEKNSYDCNNCIARDLLDT